MENLSFFLLAVFAGAGGGLIASALLHRDPSVPPPPESEPDAPEVPDYPPAAWTLYDQDDHI